MPNVFSSLHRRERIASLQAEVFDVLIIGGGITGAGIALDAAARGMRTALIEMQDFAAGTSSRSTKLIHGGLRYLKQLEVKMVSEVGRERAVVYENGPHVTTPLRMLLPFYKGGSFGPLMTSLGLKLYDVLAGVKREERRKMLSREEALRVEPLLRQAGLLGAGFYTEYRTDDARLTIEVMKKAAERGAVPTNYVKAKQFIYEDGSITGVIAQDLIGDGTFPIRARIVVNAAGPWADTVSELDQGISKMKALRLTKGIHLVFDGERFPLTHAVYFDHSDGRMLFAIPRDGKTYAGTTDTDYDGNKEHPTVTDSDLHYVLQAMNDMFPSLQLETKDVESSWAGLRPLIYEEGKSPSEVSRKDELYDSTTGLITITGGKLTGYRQMAEMVTDVVERKLRKMGKGAYSRCSTASLPISGGDVGGSRNFPRFLRDQTAEGVKRGLPVERAALLTRRYGSNVQEIFSLLPAAERPGERFGLPPDLYAMLVYSITKEMAVTPTDFFVRRTGDLFFGIDQVGRWKAGILDAMGHLLQYSESCWKQAEQELEWHIASAQVGKRARD